MTTARDDILTAIRRNRPQATERPDLHDKPWVNYDDPRAQFVSTLETVGGRAVLVKDHDALNRELGAIPDYADAQKVCSRVPGVGTSNVDPEEIDDPHGLQDVDWAILPGRFGVAENAAVWVDDRELKHRVLYVIVQHLALVLPAEQIVPNMHEAYDTLYQERGDGSNPFAEPGFGMFISGPSKTADIEQSLVIGAHGPRSLTVFLLESS